MKGYTNLTTIENYLLTIIDSSFVGQIEEWIADVEKYIDMKTGRNFIADTVATAKKYDGDNSRSILIDDCVEITEVKIGTDPALSVAVSGEEDYFLYPANDVPKTKIKLTGGIFPSWPMQCVSVKAKWGFSVDVPADIRQAATVLVAGIINYSLNADGEVKSMSIGRYTVTYKDEKQWQDFDRLEEVFKHYLKFNL